MSFNRLSARNNGRADEWGTRWTHIFSAWWRQIRQAYDKYENLNANLFESFERERDVVLVIILLFFMSLALSLGSFVWWPKYSCHCNLGKFFKKLRAPRARQPLHQYFWPRIFHFRSFALFILAMNLLFATVTQ